jgi:hypothetical protein
VGPCDLLDKALIAHPPKVVRIYSFDVPIYLQLPGVDPNDPSVQDVLASLQADDEEQKKDKTESKEKEGQ